MNSTASPEAVNRRTIDIAPGGAIAAGAALSVLLVVVFWDFFRQQFHFATDQPADWGHTILVPAIAGYLVYLHRADLRARPLRPSWWGLAPMVTGVAWYMLCVFGPRPLYHHNAFSIGVALTLAGTCLLLAGTRAMRWLWYPLLYLWIFGQTVSEQVMNRLTFPLQDLAAKGAYIFLTVVGIDTVQEGNILTVYNSGVPQQLNVAEACSGMRMVVAFFALAAAMAYSSVRRPWQRIVLIAVALPVALFINVIRVSSLGLLSMIDSGFAEGEFHQLVGVLWLLPGLFLFMGILWMVQRLGSDDGGAHG